MISGFIRGPGDNPKPIAFSFHDKFKQGPLLSVVSPPNFHGILLVSFFFLVLNFLFSNGYLGNQSFIINIT